ncbi:hypothetical protein Lepto7375DRAFT_3265 [Leptolyngbya sp. PCC 7375]|nr:hypothetical protein Lepto7375DRAFT_3265 [Leptolyngbya sp. PCC 7375]
MSNFWPNGLELSDTQSPREILKVAQDDWYKSSNGIMTLIFQDEESKTGNQIIIVHANHVLSNRTATLFSVVHRPEIPYPVTIFPREDELPNILRKSYQKKSVTGISVASVFQDLETTVSNPWVSETPSEFRKKLSDVFNLGIVKSTILNLASIAAENVSSGDVED